MKYDQRRDFKTHENKTIPLKMNYVIRVSVPDTFHQTSQQCKNMLINKHVGHEICQQWFML